MSLARRFLVGAVTAIAAVSAALLPAGAAHAVDDLTALNRCTAGSASSLTSGRPTSDTDTTAAIDSGA